MQRHAARARLSDAPLNEGRGINPGDTSGDDRFRRRDRATPNRRSTKAGASTPATPCALGRTLWNSLLYLAQRRPGHQPRRHFVPGSPPPAASVALMRSTKAGASTPATRLLRRRTGETVCPVAQRRPGHQPRRHCSYNAGVMPAVGCLLAQRRPGHQPRRHSSGSPSARTHGRSSRPLNEGRGINPGDTYSLMVGLPHHPDARSTKAGASTPATPSISASSRRGQWSGAAQRRPGHQPRRHRPP